VLLESLVTTNQLLIGLSLTVVLAVGSQVLAGCAALLLLGMPKQAALMTGAILVVSGPTVVGPLLAFVRPSERVQRILAWEGSLIDPVGAILGAVIFHGIVAGTHHGPGAQLGQFLASIAVGAAGGAVGVGLLAAELTRPAVIRRFQDGAHVAARRGCDPPPGAAEVLFVIRADGQLVPVTEHVMPAHRGDDTMVLLEP
jgi:NhaP-type Na+/H+ or K+/H+ antiporter